MKIVLFASSADAEKSLRKKEREYLISDFRLFAEREAPEKVHPLNGWIILHPGRGRCNVKVGEYSQIIELSPENALVIFVPAGIRYFLKAISDISYTVLRDGFN